ncbi:MULTISPECIES: MauE/DoxX family redox-associated membrane protein [unclassified Streptomyces]|uniref:MauE/DoxX family redox-associated membrane protein n=1 Tax=unclassified Streptomyces TaxID=2593676 RepID=UPI0035E02CB8
MDHLLFGARCALTLTLLTSAVGKLRAPGDLGRTVADLGFVPQRLTGATAVAVIAAEVAAALLIWLPGATGAAAFLGAGALLVAFTAVLVVLIRREDDVSCACFGASRTPVGPAHLVRNGVLLAVCGLGVVALARGADAVVPPEPPAAFAAGAIAVVVGVLLIATDTLAGLFARPQ